MIWVLQDNLLISMGSSCLLMIWYAHRFPQVMNRIQRISWLSLLISQGAPGTLIGVVMELPSRVWSTETLEIGLQMVENGAGLPDSMSSRSDYDIQQEIDALKDWLCLFFGHSISLVATWYVLITYIRWSKSNSYTSGRRCNWLEPEFRWQHQLEHPPVLLKFMVVAVALKMKPFLLTWVSRPSKTPVEVLNSVHLVSSMNCLNHGVDGTSSSVFATIPLPAPRNQRWILLMLPRNESWWRLLMLLIHSHLQSLGCWSAWCWRYVYRSKQCQKKGVMLPHAVIC